MEQSKWVIVRRETGFEKFKRGLKKFLFKIFGINECSKGSNSLDETKKKKEEITIEIVL